MDNANQDLERPTIIKTDLARRIQEELGENVYLCYQCVKCTSGCPVAEFFDWQPNQIMRALQLGQEDIALESQTPWLCASCQTCSTRCPQGLDIAAIMDFLTREALACGYKSQVPEVKIMNEAFLREVRLWGRSYELGLITEMKLRTGNLFSDLDLGAKMIFRNKFPFLPHPARRPDKAKPIPGAANAVAYYPGCSLHATSPEFDHSTRAVCQALGLELIEPHGWVCCGSSSAHRADPETALRLPLENLALIEQSGFQEVTMPCAACFNRHKSALHELHQHEEKKASLDEQLGYSYQDSVYVSTLSQTILNRVSREGVAAKVKQPLKDLRLVCYYGCLLTRPPEVTGSAHPENPTDLDELMGALGAQVIDWSYKTTCCGAALSLTRIDIVRKLSGDLIQHARQAGAEAIAVACPLCHTNLDARQFQMNLPEPMPVLFFTQLMAVAFGLPDKAASLNKNLVDPRPTLSAKGLIGPS
ncbi:MAG TPA: heterodisulfide reductase-related iron-sulfur binding cluster [Anaerolineales bacterium]|nr:heterodisulfide reductase-related iron-sulfur binding cluster [Anaerolineales bacterium]